MFSKIKNWFNDNKNSIAIIVLFISALLLCANLFSRISSITVTIIGGCLTLIGIIITWYSCKKDKENEKNN